MPVKVSKINGKYQVSTPSQVHARGTTKQKAERQANLLRAVDHGWQPTHEALEQAKTLAARLLEVDEISSVPIPASGKAYARLRGMRGLRTKQQLYMRMGRDLANKDLPVQGFKSRDGTAMEGADSASVTEPLERSHVEKTNLVGGKTRGKFKFPANYAVGHAMKA